MTPELANEITGFMVSMIHMGLIISSADAFIFHNGSLQDKLLYILLGLPKYSFLWPIRVWNVAILQKIPTLPADADELFKIK